MKYALAILGKILPTLKSEVFTGNGIKTLEIWVLVTCLCGVLLGKQRSMVEGSFVICYNLFAHAKA